MVDSSAGDEPSCLFDALHFVLVLRVVVEAQGNCLAIDAGHAARVPSIGHDDLRLSDVANIGRAACKLMLMCFFGPVAL